MFCGLDKEKQMVFVWGESLGWLTLEQKELGDRLPFLKGVSRCRLIVCTFLETGIHCTQKQHQKVSNL